jgi:gamma-glutamyltranspeptidase
MVFTIAPHDRIRFTSSALSRKRSSSACAESASSAHTAWPPSPAILAPPATRSCSAAACIASTTIDGLAALGLATAPLGEYGRTGAMHGVMEDAETGHLIGAADPRRTGQAAGY